MLKRLFAIPLLFAFACGDADTFDSTELDAARAKWAIEKAETYEFEYQQSCFCRPDDLRPVLITVTSSGSSARFADGAGEAVPADSAQLMPTVEDLFDRIQTASQADVVEMSFDATRGFPTEGRFDYEDLADGGWSFEVKDFKEL